MNPEYIQVGDRLYTWKNAPEYDRIEEAKKRAISRMRKHFEKTGEYSPRLMHKYLKLHGNSKKFTPMIPWHNRIQGCINGWTTSRGEESGTHVFVFPGFGGKKNLRKIKKALMNAGVLIDGHHINSPYDCTGEYFSHSCRFYICNGRVFVTQFWGTDC